MVNPVYFDSSFFESVWQTNYNIIYLGPRFLVYNNKSNYRHHINNKTFGFFSTHSCT
jgi:hypothetical protein